MSETAGAQETSAEPHAAAADNSDSEARARRMGWRPQDEYKGTADWIPADQFISRVENEVPILRSTLRTMEERFDKQGRELADVKQVLHDFRDFASRGEQRAYERARKEIEGRIEAAVAHADTGAYKEAQAELVDLDKTLKPKAPETAAQQERPLDPAITSWVAANPWFNADRALHRVAKALDENLREEKPGMPIGDRLKAVREEVQRRYPEKFGNPRRDEPSSVGSPSAAAARRGKGRAYEDLPPEAKRACDKFVKTIPGFKRETYVKDYDWSGE